MIEQTEMIVTKWYFHLSNISNNQEQPTNTTTLDVMQKRNSIKKGIACRLNCQFKNGEGPVLDYTAEHSYVIDFADVIDKQELLRMFRNSFSNLKKGSISENWVPFCKMKPCGRWMRILSTWILCYRC